MKNTDSVLIFKAKMRVNITRGEKGMVVAKTTKGGISIMLIEVTWGWEVGWLEIFRYINH